MKATLSTEKSTEPSESFSQNVIIIHKSPVEIVNHGSEISENPCIATVHFQYNDFHIFPPHNSSGILRIHINKDDQFPVGLIAY